MRIAGFVSKAEQVEVDYIKSVHIVSRWVHEMFEEPTGNARDGPGGGPLAHGPSGPRRR